MSLFDRLKQRLNPDEKSLKNKDPAVLSTTDRQDFMFDNGMQTSMRQDDRQRKVEKLTPREYDLYLLLLEGYTLKESAKQLSIKYSTANTHMSGIYKKLEVNSRAKLIINYRDIKD